MRGYSAIGLYHPKTPANVGSAMRGAYAFSSKLFLIQGKRYKKSCTDTPQGWKHIPLIETDNLFDAIPYSCVPVGVDLIEGARPLQSYIHPERAVYIFGPEDGTLPPSIYSKCRDIISIPTTICLNLAATVNIVLYDRLVKTNY